MSRKVFFPLVILLLCSTHVHNVFALEEKPNFQVAVISDIHIKTSSPLAQEKLKVALNDFQHIAPNYNVLAVGGDMTDLGLPKEYSMFKEIVSSYKAPGSQNFMVMGNHEWFEHRNNPHTTVSDVELQKRFSKNFNVPGVYYDKWINGFHFIAIGGEKSEATMLKETNNPGDGDSAYISDQQIEWLQQTLSIHENSRQPVFVFLHQPIRDTVNGSMWGAGLKDQDLLSLLQKYPQIILFSGHSHFTMDDPNSMIQKGITMVNTSSVAYTWSHKKGEDFHSSEGVLVNVYDNKVEIKARDFANRKWLKTINIPIYQ
ncbi:hypothetical protein FZW96_08085 [Bacillus sp. BGMRC 2118]|nr:hypothetical protein FZW96_08085 [Bacillus sp. BGMRC 2118]